MREGAGTRDKTGSEWNKPVGTADKPPRDFEKDMRGQPLELRKTIGSAIKSPPFV